MNASSPNQYHVAIIGGAYSGAVSGLLLKRRNPDLRVLIIERSTKFNRKVGESTSEVAGCFLTQVLHLSSYLHREQLSKQGLRMWFTTPENQDPGKCTEMGAFYQVKLPTFQLDRSELDAHLLKLAQEEGCEILRPAKIKDLHLGGAGQNRLSIVGEEGPMEVLADWVIDASGKAAVIAQKRGTWQSLKVDHPTTAIWARFRGHRDLDSYEILKRVPELVNTCITPRSLATNHLTGYGWWCWLIPLKNGDISAGLVYDDRLFTPPDGKTLSEQLHKHLLSHPIGQLMFENAEVVDKDIRTYKGLPYYSREAAGDGFVAVGDAAGFIDPLYSQGLDYCSHTAFIGANLVADAIEGKTEDPKQAAAEYNKEYIRSYQAWFNALYREKYRYLGDARLMFAAFLMDIGTYFVGPVRFVYSDPMTQFRRLPYWGPIGGFFAWGMALYNRRLARMAERRIRKGVYGKDNLGKRWNLPQGFTPTLKNVELFMKGVRVWIGLEIEHIFLGFRKDVADEAALEKAEALTAEKTMAAV